MQICEGAVSHFYLQRCKARLQFCRLARQSCKMY
jgi:hypothetical protein